MKRFITLGPGGIIDQGAVITVASARSAPIKRLLAVTPTDKIVNLTYGYPRETILIMTGGLLVITSQTVESLTQKFESERIDNNET